ncbi:hypothetical protein [Thalassomonas sp. RHCl1]|uniref:hypothetical protein n=1 Tax=Thalassomonas sp. RHCl1 TaxID=2995320 RepID=UPI00248CF520|nr:hypothetical protein [Thalassomonas sp. RHCl1]
MTIIKSLRFLLLLALLALIVAKWDALFSMSAIIASDKIQAQVLTSKRAVITRHSRGADYTVIQYHLTLSASSGQPFHYTLDNSLLKGKAPVNGEWLSFTRLRRKSGASDYLIDRASLEQRLIQGPQLIP